jgi:hypothetical protein
LDKISEKSNTSPQVYPETPVNAKVRRSFSCSDIANIMLAQDDDDENNVSNTNKACSSFSYSATVNHQVHIETLSIKNKATVHSELTTKPLLNETYDKENPTSNLLQLPISNINTDKMLLSPINLIIDKNVDVNVNIKLNVSPKSIVNSSFMDGTHKPPQNMVTYLEKITESPLRDVNAETNQNNLINEETYSLNSSSSNVTATGAINNNVLETEKNAASSIDLLNLGEKITLIGGNDDRAKRILKKFAECALNDYDLTNKDDFRVKVESGFDYILVTAELDKFEKIVRNLKEQLYQIDQ